MKEEEEEGDLLSVGRDDANAGRRAGVRVDDLVHPFHDGGHFVRIEEGGTAHLLLVLAHHAVEHQRNVLQRTSTYTYKRQILPAFLPFHSLRPHKNAPKHGILCGRKTGHP